MVENATIFSDDLCSKKILDRLSKIILTEENNKNDILDLIRLFDEEITDIQILSPNNQPTLYIEHKHLCGSPLYVFGD